MERNESAGLPAKYANHFCIGYNREEVVLDFGQSFGSSGPFFWRIICSPPHAQELLLLLGQSLDEYRKEFGPIARPEET